VGRRWKSRPPTRNAFRVRDLPTGTVTFLFSDIEGSTKLLDELGERYSALLGEHHRRMRQAFVPRGGVEVDTAGDAFFVAFERPADALDAAAGAQESLAAIDLRVRMGIHTGQPLLTETGYVGMDVHRAARIMSAGHGGQVLVSDETRALVDHGLTDLGLHRLKDLTEPQRLWQLGDTKFPPLKALHETNLPVQPTPLVGREVELSRVLDFLARARLVTLTGAGGSGKTRLALQAAAEVADDYADGVWWVSLGSLHDPELVESVIAQAVGAKASLVDHLRGKEMMLLLDNFEQLLDAASKVAELLSQAPDLRILATSRERLGLLAEQEYPVPTMVPVEAVALFASRARQLRPDFEPDDATGEICRRLDGLPLAIELAAARIKVLSPEQMLERLGRSLDLLTGGARDAPERHQALRATIEWSYTLLADAERDLFACLGVFSGGCTLDAAEGVCEADIDTLQSLVEKSLLRRTDEGRFFMLGTIKEFAQAKLELSSRASEMREAHARFFLAVVDRAGTALWANEDPQALDEIADEQDNIRAALTWLGASGRFTDQLRVIAGVSPFWKVRGGYAEGLRWAEEALAGSAGIRSAQRAAVLQSAGAFAGSLGDNEAAEGYCLESLSIFRECGTADEVARALTSLGVHAAAAERFEAAATWYDQARTESSGASAHTRALVLGNQADLALQQGDFERALPTLAEALELERGLANQGAVGWALFNMALCLFQLDREDESRAAIREAVVHSSSVVDVVELIREFTLMGAISARRGDAKTAAALLGFGGALRDRSAFVYVGVEAELYRSTAAAVKSALGDAAYEKEYARGEEMQLGEAVECSLASID
jgi:predicted ATPase/class 3 adenylate cyclase